MTAPAPNPLIVTGVNIGTTVGTRSTTSTTTLATIRDAPSAQGALPRLMAARDQLNSVEDNVDSLTDAGHTALRQMLAVALPELREQVDRVLDIDGASNQVKPVLDGILAQLTAFSA